MSTRSAGSWCVCDKMSKSKLLRRLKKVVAVLVVALHVLLQLSCFLFTLMLCSSRGLIQLVMIIVSPLPTNNIGMRYLSIHFFLLLPFKRARIHCTSLSPTAPARCGAASSPSRRPTTTRQTQTGRCPSTRSMSLCYRSRPPISH